MRNHASGQPLPEWVDWGCCDQVYDDGIPRTGLCGAWLERAADLVDDPPHVQTLTGLEAWFSLPDQPASPAPARYKMVIVTELAIFPLLAVLTFGLAPVLASFPVLLRMLITSILMVVMMTGNGQNLPALAVRLTSSAAPGHH